MDEPFAKPTRLHDITDGPPYSIGSDFTLGRRAVVLLDGSIRTDDDNPAPDINRLHRIIVEIADALEGLIDTP
mgnify:FL=1